MITCTGHDELVEINRGSLALMGVELNWGSRAHNKAIRSDGRIRDNGLFQGRKPFGMRDRK